MKYKIRYTDSGIDTDVNNVSGERLYIKIKYHNVLVSICYTYQYNNVTITTKINQLILTYFNLYIGQSTIFDKLNLTQSITTPFTCNSIKDAFIYSYATYIVFIDLINDRLIDHLPFKFDVPCTLTDGDAASYQTLNYFLLPLTITKKIANCFIKNIVTVLIYFIEAYASLFPSGAYLDQSQLTIDTLSGLTDHLLKCKKFEKDIDNSLLYKEVESSEPFIASSTDFFENTSNRITDLSLLYNKSSIISSSETTSDFSFIGGKNKIDEHLLYKNGKSSTDLTFNDNKKIKNDLMYKKNDKSSTDLTFDKKYKSKSDFSELTFTTIKTF